MNKTELIEAIAAAAGLTKAQAGKAVDAFVDTVSDTLKKGDKVILIGFGTFETRKREARKGRNPATKEEIMIPASTSPVFKAGKKLKDAVNGSKAKGKK
ncbi:MAG: HU family DNA-binding protein [Cardiobacteriaceae bacterium]|nr:HU family DNA-binding protein [Cardiobacteriaceae bacterium]